MVSPSNHGTGVALRRTQGDTNPKKGYNAKMPQISAIAIALLIIFALIADVLTLIPIINVFVTLTVSPVLYLYWKIKGVPAYPTLIAGAIEIIPVVSMLPSITAGILAVVLIDRFGASKLGKAAPKITQKEDPLQKRLNAQQNLMRERQRQAAGYGDQRLLNQLR